MFICEICNRSFKTKRGLKIHVIRVHKIKQEDYDKNAKIKLNFYCNKCGVKLSKNNKYKTHCIKHRDRTGEKNSFYGKKHSIESISKIKIKTSIASKEKWKDNTYRNKVISGATGKKRSKKFKKKQRENALLQFKDPKQREIRSKKMKESWENGKIFHNIAKISSSKKEKELFLFFKKNLKNSNVDKKTVRSGKKYFFPDIVIEDKIIVEYYGDYWHGNPKKYKKGDLVAKNIPAEKVWKRDKIRQNKLEKLGYKFYIVWQSDDSKKYRKRLLSQIRKDLLL